MNITLITSIVLTATMTAAGTYYVTTQNQANPDASVGTAVTPVPAIAEQAINKPAVPVVVANLPAKQPIEITVKTEIIARQHPLKRHNFRAEAIAAANAPQPHFGIYPGK